MLKTAHDAEEFMRTGARVSPSWPGGDLRGRIRCSRLISRRSRQNPLQTGRAIRFQHYLRKAINIAMIMGIGRLNGVLLNARREITHPQIAKPIARAFLAPSTVSLVIRI